MQFGVGGCERDQVSAGGFAADEGEQADLVGDGLEKLVAFAEVLIAGLVNVAHGGGRRRRAAGFDLEFGDSVPDFALVRLGRAARFEGLVDGAGFAGAGLVGHHVAGFAEGLGGVGPAALLGATDRDLCLRDFFD